MLTYGDFGFRCVMGRAHRLAGRASAARNVAFRGGVQLSCRPGSGIEMVAGAIGRVARASDIVAGSGKLSERDEAEPCRVMTWSSRSLRQRAAVRAAGANVRRFR